MKQLVLVLALIACGKKDKDKAPDPAPPGAGSGSTVAGSGSAGSGSAGSAAMSVQAGAPCDEPCLLLQTEDIPAVRTRCPDWSLGKHPAHCDDTDYVRNCIYASYGYTFKKDRWKQEFAGKRWYKPDPAFSEAAMSKAAIANVAELKHLAEACRVHNEKQISPATRKVVEEWFAVRAKGKIPPLPDRLTDLEGLPIEKDEFAKKYLTDKDDQLFIKDEWEPIEWVEKKGAAEVVRVSTGVPDPATCKGEGEDCEGFESIEFAVHKGEIDEITTFAAACPFVYELDAGGRWAYRGEILKNLATAAAEATRTLALADGTCAATRTIRISEDKRERTYLDSVALAIDGSTVVPDGCRDGGPGTVCTDDGRYLELATGDAIELVFTLPAATCAAGTLIANGYYVPVR